MQLLGQKTLTSLILLLLCLFKSSFLLGALVSVDVKAESAILMNADTGAILYEKNARKKLYPASITKVATAAYVLKVQGHKLDTLIEAEQDAIGWVSEEAQRRSNYSLPAHWLTPGGTHINIKKGEKLPLEALLYGMMLASGNDASNVVAQYVGGTVPDFMNMLNAHLKEIGCKDTTFYNPHGIHHPQHLTTAYDMAVITREALKDPMFQKIVSTVRYTRPKTNMQKETPIIQMNALLRKGKHYYRDAIGVKTGYHSNAMNTLVAAAKRGDRTLIAVLLKEKERKLGFQDAIKLFDAAFELPKVRRTFLRAGKQRVALKLPDAAKPVRVYIPEDLYVEYYKGEEPKVKCLLSWDEVSVPIEKGQRLGQYTLKREDGAVIKTVPIYARESVSSGWWARAREFFIGEKARGASLFAKIFGGLILILMVGFLVLQLNRR